MNESQQKLKEEFEQLNKAKLINGKFYHTCEMLSGLPVDEDGICCNCIAFPDIKGVNPLNKHLPRGSNFTQKKKKRK